ncbi:pyruvate formate lyase family protein [Thermophilibacter sp.]
MKNDKSVAEIVEVNKKIPCEKSLEEQIDLIEAYTNAHRANLSSSVTKREVACLRVLYPATFRHVEDTDLVVGRTDVMPVGLGCVTSVGGTGHYCSFSKLHALRDQCSDAADVARLDAVEAYWNEHDTRSIFFEDTLTDETLGKFVDAKYAAVVTARLSGTMLNYEELVELGVPGLRAKVAAARRTNPSSAEFYEGLDACLDILVSSLERHIELCEQAKAGKGPERVAQLERVQRALANITHEAPRTLIEGIELCWIFTLMAGVVNYGRADVYLGTLLDRDLRSGELTRDEALAVIKSWFKLIEARRSNVNGRVIVGGRDRTNVVAADEFCRFAIRAVRENRDVEPQFTLRIYDDMAPDVYDRALEAIGSGCTYPLLYNDEAIIPEVVHALNVDEETAEGYVPFGCGELVINHASVGTPNVLYNVLKMLEISLNGGVDPWDGVDRSNGIELLPAQAISSFDQLYDQYKRLIHSYIELGTRAHRHSYEILAQEADFLFTSLLSDDCVERGKAILKGGIRYEGGTCETYGNINASDSLVAIRRLVFERGTHTLAEVVAAMNANFEGYESLRAEMLACPKYGNDDPVADNMAADLHDFLCQDVREAGLSMGFYSYNLVVINNQVNTEWGRKTAASPDGRPSGMFMNNGNNPQSGADKNGPTAMLNSLLRLKIENHAGSVQNIKLSKGMFRERRGIVKALFDSYFRRGGGQLMASVVDPGELEDALVHPELHQNLIVRVGGFSARFVALEKDVQQEVLARTLNE